MEAKDPVKNRDKGKVEAQPVEIHGQSEPVVVTQAIGSPPSEADATARKAAVESTRAAKVAEVSLDNAVAESTRVAMVLEETERLKAEALELLRIGQRKINLIWEVTQAVVAISVVASTMAIAGSLVIIGAVQAVNGQSDAAVQSLATGAFVFLAGAANLIIGFYFSRTNHQNVGGVSAGDTGR